MDNNNYQPHHPTSDYQQPTQLNVLPQELQQRIDDAFGKALASTIMSEFPVTSIIAIFFGNNALKEIVALMEICNSMGMRTPGKLIAARVLGIVGKISGIVCTCIYGFTAIFYAFYFFLAIFLYSADMMSGLL